MKVSDLMRKSILPLIWLGLITLVGKQFFMVNGEFDLFRACLVYGIPFGIPYMIFVIPLGETLSGTMGYLAFTVIIGGLFGAIIALFTAVKAAVLLIWFFVSRLFRR